ncbi:23S rRNA (pseudouridine(1915)-N(3))-methyltransferase RlmH, partial [Staphylococcus aureus]|uniref:23S rRNA (pseudouridine(1915)-N(3))-methyltransferase RlmH n=1 Tax=Staphylococcus aureus TaxID=1280 RepID=UPI0037DA3A94
MKITILPLPKLKHKYSNQPIPQYQKPLPPYTNIHIIQLPHQKPPQNITDKQIQQLKQKQPQRILPKIRPQSTLI